jgi:hypothetical protein
VGTLGEGVAMQRNSMLVGVVALLLLGGCASGEDPATDTSPAQPSASSTAPTAGNGSAFASAWSEEVTWTRYPILSDGTVGEGVEVLTGAVDDETFPAIVDGVGEAIATGTFEDYFTADIALRSGAGEVVSQVDVDQWCGGEGLGFTICVLLDDLRLARTSMLGGADTDGATLTVSSLRDGSTTDELGPFRGLFSVLGTEDADLVMLASSQGPQSDVPENLAGTVQRLDLATGQLSEIGQSPADWAPLCALGTDAVLGFTVGDVPTAVAVGDAQVGAVEWSEDEDPIGCSADGRFLYLQHFPQPPDSEDDTEPPNPPTTLDRVTLADGTRESVLVLDPGVSAGPITR